MLHSLNLHIFILQHHLIWEGWKLLAVDQGALRNMNLISHHLGWLRHLVVISEAVRSLYLLIYERRGSHQVKRCCLTFDRMPGLLIKWTTVDLENGTPWSLIWWHRKDVLASQDNLIIHDLSWGLPWRHFYPSQPDLFSLAVWPISYPDSPIVELLLKILHLFVPDILVLAHPLNFVKIQLGHGFDLLLFRFMLR